MGSTWIQDADNVRTLIYLGCYLTFLVLICFYSAVSNIRKFHSDTCRSSPSATNVVLKSPSIPHTGQHSKSPTTPTNNHNDGHHLELAISGENAASTRHIHLNINVNNNNNNNNIAGNDKRGENRHSNVNNNNRVPNSSHVASRTLSFYSNTNYSIRSQGVDMDAMSCYECVIILFSVEFCVSLGKIVTSQRGIYTTVLVYAFDIVTDMNVMIYWFKNGPIKFGALSLAVLLTYRIVSSYSVYHAIRTKKGKLVGALLQFLDVYILYEVLKSHRKHKKTERLLWISAMEAALEAVPQLVLQIVYLVKHSDQESTNSLVVLGLFFSVCKLGTTVMSGDKLVCI